jgi:hypothetical protein
MEYPWYAAWDLAFHMASFVEIDPYFAKNNYCLFYEKVTCILTAKFRPTSGILATWIRLCILGQSGMYNKDKEQTGEGDTVFWNCFPKTTNYIYGQPKKTRMELIFWRRISRLDNIGVFDRNHMPKGITRMQQADTSWWLCSPKHVTHVLRIV